MVITKWLELFKPHLYTDFLYTVIQRSGGLAWLLCAASGGEEFYAFPGRKAQKTTGHQVPQ